MLDDKILKIEERKDYYKVTIQTNKKIVFLFPKKMIEEKNFNTIDKSIIMLLNKDRLNNPNRREDRC